jgi:hypothetical protein
MCPQLGERGVPRVEFAPIVRGPAAGHQGRYQQHLPTCCPDYAGSHAPAPSSRHAGMLELGVTLEWMMIILNDLLL